MGSKTFTIRFITSESCDNRNIGKLFEYEASVSVLSKSLGLYKVSDMHKLADDERSPFPNALYLTCYPLQNNKDDRWVDPITNTSSNFLRILGQTIETANAELEMIYLSSCCRKIFS